MSNDSGGNHPTNNNAKRRRTAPNSFFRLANRFQNQNQNNGPRQNVVSMLIPSNGPADAASTQPGTPIPSATNFGKYSSWQLYFPDTDYKDGQELIKKVEAFERHISERPLLYKLTDICSKLWFHLPLQSLLSDNHFKRQYPDFMEDLKKSPAETMACAGLAAHFLIRSSPAASASRLSLFNIRPRIQGYGPIIHLSLLREDIYKCLIAIRGTVVRVGPPEVKQSWIAYRCRKCSTEQAVRQTESSKAIAPTSCKGPGCKSREQFIMLQNSPYTQCEPFQVVRLQENVQMVKGQIPKTIEVDLAHDLVETVYPGDDVTVTGIMKVRTFDATGFHKPRGCDAGIHKFYLYGISIVSNKNTINTRSMDLDENEVAAIKEIRNRPNLFKLLVHSICPRIFGHEMVKAGLILSLFGGSGNGVNADRRPGVGKRSEIHVLVVGDPGLGKSILIQSCSNVSPRGIFVCGNSTSNAGLTVSIRHDKGSSDSLEAGALVLADQGVCCIDEFDKMPNNYQSLLQAMEQQTVSVAKAGVICALPARTSIIAAANPSGGHYDKAKTVSENLKIWPTILSRFDLVFILLDRCDAHLDQLLTEHIQMLKQKQYTSNVRTQVSGARPPPHPRAHLSPEGDTDLPLHERLKLADQAHFDALSPELLRKYVMYARKTCFPTLSPEACSELYNFYAELRLTRKGVDSVPVTTRQLEALIRLTQARARLELCNIATIEHARDVLAIFRYTMVDVLSTDRGSLQLNRSINGSGISHATKVKRFLHMLQGQMKKMFTMRELSEVAQSMGFESSCRQIVDSLNVQGFLIKRGKDLYKFSE